MIDKTYKEMLLDEKRELIILLFDAYESAVNNNYSESEGHLFAAASLGGWWNERDFMIVENYLSSQDYGKYTSKLSSFIKKRLKDFGPSESSE